MTAPLMQQRPKSRNYHPEIPLADTAEPATLPVDDADALPPRIVALHYGLNVETAEASQ